MGTFILGVVVVICVVAFYCAIAAIYFIPAIYAWSNKHKDSRAIFLLNLLLGWTFVGWVVALVWAAKH